MSVPTYNLFQNLTSAFDKPVEKYYFKWLFVHTCTNVKNNMNSIQSISNALPVSIVSSEELLLGFFPQGVIEPLAHWSII